MSSLILKRAVASRTLRARMQAARDSVRRNGWPISNPADDDFCFCGNEPVIRAALLPGARAHRLSAGLTSVFSMAPVSTNALSWLGESSYALARYRAFLKHARKPSSHDQQSPRHGVWPTCGPNCAAYIAHSFPGTLGLFCRTLRLRPHMNSAKP
jgi:hypothetical protein